MEAKRFTEHFSPKKGWTNDPNGLVVIDGVYHLFFQHYPEDMKWGPMHWGHAVSRDGRTWEEWPIAIYPDENGYIFSGSCIWDRDNVSGLGSKEKPALLAFYTLHEPTTGQQQQCLAYSTDYRNFTKYSDNPIISNCYGSDDFHKDFRDPKVFANPVLGGYSMVIAQGERLAFYHSRDLVHWEKTGETDVSPFWGSGICECPDCLLIDDQWVLTVSYIPTSVAENEVRSYRERHTMNYLFGTFDGNGFIVDAQEPMDLYWDYGPDHYAMVSFAGTELVMGWGENWDYVYDIPADTTRGKMTVIRRASVRQAPAGKRLCFAFLEDQPREEISLSPGEKMEIRANNGNTLMIEVFEESIQVTRGPIPETVGSRWLSLPGYRAFSAPRAYTGICHLEIVMERDFFEILADEGSVCFSVQC